MADKRPALLVLTEEKWADHIFVSQEQGRKKSCFRSDACMMKNIGKYGIKHIYFKKNDKGPGISMKADYIETTKENPKEFRMPDCENKPGKYYYLFKNLRMLKMACDVSELKYYNTGNALPNSVQGPCIIIDPELE